MKKQKLHINLETSKPNYKYENRGVPIIPNKALECNRTKKEAGMDVERKEK